MGRKVFPTESSAVLNITFLLPSFGELVHPNSLVRLQVPEAVLDPYTVSFKKGLYDQIYAT